MYPNRFYTEWLVNEIVMLKKKIRELEHKEESTYNKGYIEGIKYVIEDLRDVLNYEDKEINNGQYEE